MGRPRNDRPDDDDLSDQYADWEAERDTNGPFQFDREELHAVRFSELAENDRALEVAADYYAPGIEATPPHWRGWLRRQIWRYVRALCRSSEVRRLLETTCNVRAAHRMAEESLVEAQFRNPLYRADGFFDDMLRDGHGAVRAVLLNINSNDYERPEDADADNLAPIFPQAANRAAYFSFVIDGLSDRDPYFASLAAKWLPEFAPDTETAVAVLTDSLRSEFPLVRLWAAIHLSYSAPTTPGLAETLAESLAGSWTSSDGREYNLGEYLGYWGGRTWNSTFDALDRLGPGAWDALGPAAVPGLLFALRTNRAIQAAAVLARVGPASLELFRRVESFASEIYNEQARQATARALAEIQRRPPREPAAAAPGRDDESFLHAVYAAPGDHLPQLIYADWLDEHGRPAEAEYIRLGCELSHLALADPRCDEWAERLGTVRDRIAASNGEWLHVWDWLTDRTPPDSRGEVV